VIELSDRTEDIFAEPDAGEELFALRFFLHAKDVNSFNLWEYFTSVKGIIMTLIGLLLSTPFFVIVFDGSIWHRERWIVMIFFFLLPFGLLLLLADPIILCRIYGKAFGKNSIINNEISYRFYKDFFLMETVHENIRLQVYWRDLVKISTPPHAYWLYNTKKEAHIIPKRAFADAEDKKEMMKTLLDDCRNLIKAR